MIDQSFDDLVWEWRSLTELSVETLHACMALRQEVFILEQRCLYLDADHYDHISAHLMVWHNPTSNHQTQRTLIAYLRTYQKGEEWRIGRVLVSSPHRSIGLGAEMMRRAHQFLTEQGVNRVGLAAQIQVRSFYEKLGYHTKGEPFMDAGIPHQEMVLNLGWESDRTPIKVIIFDFDGTLVDSAYDYALCFQTLASEWPGSRPAPRADQIRDLMYAGVRPQLEYTLGPLKEEEYLKALEHFREVCLKVPLVHTTLYPGVRSVLDRLQRLGFRLAVCTNRPEDLCVQALEALEIKDYFEYVVGGDRGLERKPSPEMLSYLFTKLRVSAKECILVGDSDVDLSAALNSGCMPAIAYWGYTPREHFDEMDDSSSFRGLERIGDLFEILNHEATHENV